MEVRWLVEVRGFETDPHNEPFSKIISYNRGVAKCEGKGTVNEKLACSAEFSVVLPHVINNYKQK